jgi:hypothetical protein
MNWISFDKEKPPEEKIYFSTNGKTVFVHKNRLNPFMFQLYGEYTLFSDYKPTHWFCLGDLPKNHKEVK